MINLFHFANLVQNDSFGAGLLPVEVKHTVYVNTVSFPDGYDHADADAAFHKATTDFPAYKAEFTRLMTEPPVRRPQRSAEDAAWHLGYTLACESDSPVYPPARFSPEEKLAFEDGAIQGARQVADWDDQLIEMALEREIIRLHSEGYAHY